MQEAEIGRRWPESGCSAHLKRLSFLLRLASWP